MKLVSATAIVFALVLGTHSASLSAQQDPFNGTWKLNIAKSTMQAGTASKSETLHYKIVGDEEDFVSEAITAKDEPESIKYRAKYNDTTGVPMTTTVAGNVRTGTTIVKKVDLWTRERYNVRDGKATIGSRRIVSKDGKMLTLTIVRVGADGKESIAETRIFDKQ